MLFYRKTFLFEYILHKFLLCIFSLLLQSEIVMMSEQEF